MRILMVTNTYAPARNGVAFWTAMTVRELRAHGHEVDVLTYAHDGRGDDAGVHALPAWIGLDSDFKVSPILSGLPDEVAKGSWDIVHAHHPVLLGRHAPRIARGCGAKFFFTSHSVYTDYLDEYAWGSARFLAPALASRVARFANGCDVALAPSTHVADWLYGSGVRAPIELLEAPADVERVPPQPREDARKVLGLSYERVALYVGRLAAEKRLEELLQEFVSVSSQVPEARLVLAGRGPLQSSLLKRGERLGIAGKLSVLTELGGAELGAWYSAADVHVSASRSETGPMTVVEAMACGTPTVAYRAPGFEDRIEDGCNGFLVEDRPGRLGEAMTRVLADDSLRVTLGEGARERSLRYTPAAVTERLIGMYERAIA